MNALTRPDHRIGLDHRPGLRHRLGLDRRGGLARLIAVALLPVMVLGLLLAALWNPVDRLDTVHAAIVNLDEPVTVDGQTVPLGRQLAAGLVSGAAPSTEQTLKAAPATDAGYQWQITNAADARAGLADGTFEAVVTIPKDFSAAATSFSGDAADARQATIDIATPPGGRVADAVIARYVASTATSVMGSSLTQTYVDNVLIGLTTMSDQLGQAADGATALADGATQASDGAGQLADGAGQLADGATAAASGANQLATGAGQLAGGARSAADGANQLAAGASQAASGARDLATGADTLAGGATALATGAGGVAGGIADSQAGAQDLATGVQDLAAGLTQMSDQVTAARDTVTGVLPPLTDLTDGLISAAGDIQATGNAMVTELTTQIDALRAAGCTEADTDAPCSLLPGLVALRTGIQQGVAQLDDPQAVAGSIQAGVGQLDAMVDGLSDAAQGATALGAGVQDLADGLGNLAGGANQVADGATGLASGAGDLATGARALSGGVAQVADGSAGLSNGVGQLATGATGIAGGTRDLAGGVGELATGAGGLATGADGIKDGAQQLATGAGDLADGLGTAVSSLPSYTDAERANLSAVVADPVRAPGDDSLDVGSTGPLFAVIALWLGALGLTTVVRPSRARALAATRGTVGIALRDLAVPSAVAVVTGAVVGGILAGVEHLSVGGWVGAIGLGAVVSVVFVALHQGFTLLLGDLARGASLLIAVLVIATGVVATVPAWLVGVADFLAIGAARRALVGLVVPGAGGVVAPVVSLVVWGLAGVALAVLMTARARTLRVSRLLAAG